MEKKNLETNEEENNKLKKFLEERKKEENKKLKKLLEERN